MKTRSETRSSDSRLSVSPYGGRVRAPTSPIRTRRGPNSPKCSQAEDEPGPPLKAKVTGRLSGSTSSSTSAVEKIWARGCRPRKLPSSTTSSRSTRRPVVVVYLSRVRPAPIEWLVVTRSSSGGAGGGGAGALWSSGMSRTLRDPADSAGRLGRGAGGDRQHEENPADQSDDGHDPQDQAGGTPAASGVAGRVAVDVPPNLEPQHDRHNAHEAADGAGQAEDRSDDPRDQGGGRLRVLHGAGPVVGVLAAVAARVGSDAVAGRVGVAVLGRPIPPVARRRLGTGCRGLLGVLLRAGGLVRVRAGLTVGLVRVRLGLGAGVVVVPVGLVGVAVAVRPSRASRPVRRVTGSGRGRSRPGVGWVAVRVSGGGVADLLARGAPGIRRIGAGGPGRSALPAERVRCVRVLGGWLPPFRPSVVAVGLFGAGT